MRMIGWSNRLVSIPDEARIAVWRSGMTVWRSGGLAVWRAVGRSGGRAVWHDGLAV